MARLYDKYKDDGLVVLGVHAWNGRESEGDVRKFVEEYKVTYPVLLGGREAHQELYKCEYVPRVFFIDRRGRIVATHVGFDEGDVAKFEKRIEDLL